VVKFLHSLETLISNPVVGIGVACLLVVIAWKMNQLWSNWLLVFAWLVFVISSFRFEPISTQPLIPRLLWTMAFSAVIGLPFYYLLWTPRNVNNSVSTQDSWRQERASSASAAPTVMAGLPFVHIGGHAEIVMQHNILPDAAHIEATDHAKGNLSDNFFYQTRPLQANPQAPDFIGKIWIVSMNYTENTAENALIIFALLEMKNRGSPSVVDEFHGTLKIADKTWEIQRSQRLPSNLTILREDNSEIKMDETDMLYSKLATGDPVVQGARLAGWLLFEVKGGPIDPPKFEFTIYFSDVNGKEYSVVTTTDELSKTSVPFIPGVNNPFFPKQPSPTPDKGASPH
jgi:hypothetical protein